MQIKIKRHKVHDEYEKAVQWCMQYHKLEVLAPRHIESQFYEKLANLRSYLDNQGCYMKTAKYRYDPKDKSTWKYLDHVTKNGKYLGAVENPFFCPKYK